MPPSNKRENEQPDIHRWLRQTSQEPEIIGIEQTNSSCEIGTTVVEAEIHPVPAESSLETEDTDNNNHNNNDPIDIALNIAKEATSVKNDIQRIENIIMHTQNTQTREYNTLLQILNSIQNNVNKIDEKVNILEEKIQHLSSKLITQEKSLNKAQQDIQTLFNSIATLGNNQKTQSNEVSNSVMEVDANECEKINNSIIISNLPNRDRDEEDVLALLYIGLSMPINNVEIKSMDRAESKSERPGNIVVEFVHIQQKITALRKKRDLRCTNEYHNVFIRNVKSRSNIIVEWNFSTILKNLPRNHNLMMDSNVKFITRNTTIMNNQ